METPEPAAAPATPVPSERRHLLERVGEAAVVQLYADGFARLPTEAKILAFHLTNAALAGRNIFLDQKYEHSLVLREFLEELFLHRAILTESARKEIERYTKLFWLNNGPHNHETSRKEPWNLTFGEFREAVDAAESDGARMPWMGEQSRDEMLRWLFDVALDANVDPVCTNKSPGEGVDILDASCANFYKNVQLADLKGFEERYPLNARLVKTESGALVEEVWRCGDGALVPPGLYAKEISRIVANLRQALPFAPSPTRRALEHLIRFYETGNPEDFRQYNIAWVADKDSVIDTVNGFIEVYVDPRGQKGAFEGIVSYVNHDKTAAIRAIAMNAAWFEARMPWDSRYRKNDVRGITANAIDVILETGDSGPVTPIGINLPNPQDIREQYGSKSVNLSNVVEAYEKSQLTTLRKEFCYSDAEYERSKKWNFIVNDVHTNMHEVIGHASGRLADHVGDPSKALREYYSTLEEARADLVALWFLADPEVIERGMSPGLDAALAEYEGYTRNGIMGQLRRVKTGNRIEEDHARNRQLIVQWIFRNSNAIGKIRENGKTYFVVNSLTEWRAAAGRLLAEIMRVKGEGDYAKAKELVEGYGVTFDPALRDEVLERIAAVDPPSYTAFVQPRLTAIRDVKGDIVNVEIDYPCDLAAQMLEWSGKAPARSQAPAGP